MLARRFGESRAGAVLDPTADKVFMAAAFFTVARTGLLHPLEIVGVLARDIVAALGDGGAWLWRRPTPLPAPARGQGGPGAAPLPVGGVHPPLPPGGAPPPGAR